MEYASESIQRVIDEFSKLPGVGKKTALRLALHLLKCSPEDAEGLAQSVLALRKNTRRCIVCNNITEQEICLICQNPKRDQETVCVVEEIRDLLAIERTRGYNGLYHVLGGVINPLAGIGPGQLAIEGLITRASACKEIILALNATMEGETTAFYIAKKLRDLPIIVSAPARGLPVGGELELADEVTLARSIEKRSLYTIQAAE